MNIFEKCMDWVDERVKAWHVVLYAVLLLGYDFLIFGENDEIFKKTIVAVLFMVFIYFGSYFVLYIQVKNPLAPKRFVKVFSMFLFYFGLVFGVLSMINHLAKGFVPLAFAMPGMCMAMLKVRRKAIEEEQNK